MKLFAEIFVGYLFFSVLALYVANRDPANYRQLGWLWYVTVQLVQLFFTVLGWFLLIAPCLLRAWKMNGASIKQWPAPYEHLNGRQIDTWSWRILRWLGYHNSEDGDSGQTALIWGSGADAGKLVAYANPKWPRWSAYCWSALRNSADGWKYRFAWENGPQAQLFGRKLGWWTENNRKVPLL